MEAVVVTCSWLVPGVVTGLGLSEVVVPDGAPCKVRVTGAVKPQLAVNERV